MITAIALVAHEIPQEVGDFLILLHSGYSKRRAFIFNGTVIMMKRDGWKL